MSETPFRVAVPDYKLAQLRAKLDLTSFPDELVDARWTYGAPLADIRRLVARWKDGYQWREHEAELNQLPQFTRDIEVDGHGSLNIHYLHHQSEVVGAIPLLFVHGWPGSFIEVQKILPLLTAASHEHPSFHVVALSLPGFGFSQAPRSKGFKAAHYAEVGNKLMLALGYNEYVTQGGDWGFDITRKAASLYGGKSVKAWHTNFPRGQPPQLLSTPLLYLSNLVTPYTATERARLERMQWFQTVGRGYFMEQSTQPQTLGYGLTDSPAGLLAWIYEKLVTWTDSYPWDDDEVLTWVSIYWFSRAGPAASFRIYYEFVQGGDLDLPLSELPTIPLGLSFFPKEIYIAPKRWTRSMGRVVFDSEHTSGGHFAAHEKPAELADDVRKMFATGGPAFGVVSGKTGYA
jgi:pimeloyl-ACP methyl ester carboxylesterase